MRKVTGVCGLAENIKVSSCQKNKFLKQTLCKGSGGKTALEREAVGLQNYLYRCLVATLLMILETLPACP